MRKPWQQPKGGLEWQSADQVSCRPFGLTGRTADQPVGFGQRPLLMTEKDAVKCAGLTAGEAWVLPVEAVLPPALIDLIVEKLRGRPTA